MSSWLLRLSSNVYGPFNKEQIKGFLNQQEDIKEQFVNICVCRPLGLWIPFREELILEDVYEEILELVMDTESGVEKESVECSEHSLEKFNLDQHSVEDTSSGSVEKKEESQQMLDPVLGSLGAQNPPSSGADVKASKEAHHVNVVAARSTMTSHASPKVLKNKYAYQQNSKSLLFTLSSALSVIFTGAIAVIVVGAAGYYFGFYSKKIGGGEKIDFLVKQADAHWNKREPDKALDLYKSALSKNPVSFYSKFSALNYFDILTFKKNTSDMSSFWEELRVHNPELLLSYHYYLRRGIYNFYSDQYESAARDFTLAISEAEGRLKTFSLFNLAATYLKMKKLNQSLGFLDQTERESKDLGRSNLSWSITQLRAMNYFYRAKKEDFKNLENVHKARSIFKENASRLNPFQFQAFIMSFYLDYVISKKVPNYKSFFQIDFSLDDAFLKNALLGPYFSWDQIFPFCNNMVENGKGSSFDKHFAIALCFTKQGRSRKAQALAEDLLKRDPRNSFVYSLLAYIFLKSESAEKSQTYLSKAVISDLELQNPVSRVMMAKVCDQKKLKCSLNYWKQVYDRFPNFKAQAATGLLKHYLLKIETQESVQKLAAEAKVKSYLPYLDIEDKVLQALRRLKSKKL